MTGLVRTAIAAALLSVAPASTVGAAPPEKVADVAAGSVAVDGHRVVFEDLADRLMLYDSRDGSRRTVLPATDVPPALNSIPITRCRASATTGTREASATGDASGSS